MSKLTIQFNKLGKTIMDINSIFYNSYVKVKNHREFNEGEWRHENANKEDI